MNRPALAALCLALLTFPALAQDPRTVPAPQQAELPTVPGGDIFGFTSGTDVGNPGDRGIAFEFSARAGRIGGSYLTGTLKTQLSFTVAPDVAIAVSPFVTWHRSRGVPGIDDISRGQFDGLSFEASWRFLQRTASGFAATVSIEPRYARVDGISGQRVDAYSAELKLFMDVVLIPDRLFAAVNLNFAPGASQAITLDGMTGWQMSSGTNLSAALAYQITPQLFAGVEARLLSVFDGAFLNRNTGNALFAGPNLLYRPADNVAINVVWTPQVWGRARTPDRVADGLDLNNFERHQFRMKATIGF